MELLIFKYWKPLALVGILAFASLQTWRIERLHADLAHAKAAEAQQRQLAADTEQARKTDHDAAQSSYDTMQTSCASSITNAIRKGRTIEGIIQTTPPADGPRGIVSADSLRAVVEAAPADPGPPSVPPGGHSPRP